MAGARPRHRTQGAHGHGGRGFLMGLLCGAGLMYGFDQWRAGTLVMPEWLLENPAQTGQEKDSASTPMVFYEMLLDKGETLVSDQEGAAPPARMTGIEMFPQDAATSPATAPENAASDTTKAAPAPATTPPPAAPATAPAGTESYLVQLGAFRSNAEADELRAQLALQGLRASIQKISNDKGVWHRVRMGPYPSLDAARAAQKRLQGAGVKGSVVKASG